MKTLLPEEYERRFSDAGGLPRAAELCLTEREDCLLPPRSPRSHKYSYGRALLIAGSVGYSGAPALAANACERGGAGLTELMVPEGIYPIAAARCDGAVVTPLPAGEDGCVSADALPPVLRRLERADACAVGPGLGTGRCSRELVTAVLQAAECPLILDADALTVCGRDPELTASCRAPLILTPHEGEFVRLGGDLSAGRLAGALAFTAGRPELILILKGHGTLVCRDGEAAVNPTGSAAMAKGGSGDVLCGLLCALLAQGFDPWFSARCAVYLHGLSGDLARDALGEYAVTPSDLIRFLPAALRRVCGEAASC